jgi:4-hydroxybenzoate polyprenyltransferase
VLGLLRASHPGPTVVVTTIAVLLASGLSATFAMVALVGVTVLVGQLSIGWSNDWWDAERDATIGRGDKPVATGAVPVSSVRVAALTAGVASVPLSLLSGWRAGACHLLLVASGWAYNAGLKRVLASPIPYAIGFGALPGYVWLVAGEPLEVWVVAVGSLLGLAAHFANAAPDIADDRSLGVWGAPQRIGQRGSLAVAMATLGAAGVILVRQLESGSAQLVGLVVVLAPIAVSAALLSAIRVRAVFVVVMVAAVADVSLLVWVA